MTENFPGTSEILVLLVGCFWQSRRFLKDLSPGFWPGLVGWLVWFGFGLPALHYGKTQKTLYRYKECL